MQFTTKQINEIAQSLQCGEAVYIEKANGQIHILLDVNDPYFDEGCLPEEEWEGIYQRVQFEPLAFFKVDKMPSRRAFQVMEDFAKEEVADRHLRYQLLNALEKRKPFANFKRTVEQSSARMAWFAYRDRQEEAWVKRELRYFDIDDEEE